MEASAADRELWAAIVEAERELARARAAFHQRATGRVEVLRQALNGRAWDRGSALGYLQGLPADVPELADSLATVALSDAWAREARRALQGCAQAVVREKVAGWAMG